MLTNDDVFKFVYEWRAQVDNNYAKTRGDDNLQTIDQLKDSYGEFAEDGDELVRKLRMWLNQRENLNRNPQVWMFRKWLQNMAYDPSEESTTFVKHKLCGLCRGTKTIDCMAPYNTVTGDYKFPDELQPGEAYQCDRPYRMEPAWIPCKCSDVEVSEECKRFREKLIRYVSELREPYQTGEDAGVIIKRCLRKVRGITQDMLTEDAKQEDNDDGFVDDWEGVEDVPNSEIPF